ncbi:hypothetical protein D7D52_19125 [Nocardia yunnanensis]|uniref:Sensor domain-containing protein n=1 Tax=Nocardia yunnanensis TaxID=2382165 RepID=A0A386ZDL4_9NOCA|nr:hypothetical protein [Nocardia yunnanensis]AYF75616.1 hypothetical protein D7D52_19125 [Nocardia yunnanensis]
MTRFALLAGAVALTVGACGNHKDSAPALPGLGPTVQPARTPGGAAVPDQYTLRSNLLDASQLPAGFTPLDDPPPGNTGGAGGKTDPPQCANVLAAIAAQAPGAAAQAAAQFAGQNFASVDVDAASYANGGAAQAFSAAQQLVRGCTRYSGKDADNTKVDFQVGGLTQPQAGDGSASFQVRTTSDGLTLYTDVSITLVGSTVVQIAYSDSKEPDPQQLSAMTAAQVRKLRGAAGP